ncbi:helix-turn-helix domain-containing protein [Candidatus Woesearchaeota archaeon]|nr:helix-turn-helix domain-containing protein [Candidatus Woesearchaeota archaeon]
MGQESFVLVSLKEEKTKKLAQVISNQSCRAILDFLAKNEATESEIAKKLSLPMSTVHYNLKHLLSAGLVSAEEFHYSPKGKEVLHYKLSNKYVIIAPKSTFGIKEKLKSILPVAIITIAVAGVIQLFSQGYSKILRSGPWGSIQSSEAFREVAPKATEDLAAGQVLSEGGGAAAGLAERSAETASNVTETVAENGTRIIERTTEVVREYTVTRNIVPDNIALWFLAGAFFAIIIYLLVNHIMKKRSGL